LNYGVSLPTLRSIATAEQRDHSLAQYLYKQQVRELRLAALHIAKPEEVTLSEATFWAEGVINSEVAEEMSFALLCKAADAKLIIEEWSKSDNEFLTYAALMAAARNADNISLELPTSTPSIIEKYPASRIIAQGIVALLVAAYKSNKDAVAAIIVNIKNTITQQQDGFSAAQYIIEELEWRIEE
jgi:3-methyladenine DNA glycosylase AlkD